MSDCFRGAARGGCWAITPANARVANRYWTTPSFRYFILGFRLVEEVEEVDRGARGLRAYRGGSWSFSSAVARVAFRFRYAPYSRDGRLGFRLVEETSNITNGE